MKFTSALRLKLIYVFRINDEAHKGCLKIGETTSDTENIWGLEPNSKVLNKAAKKRIDQYTQTAGIAYDLLYTELTIYNDINGLKSFSDHEVHKVLTRSGIKKKTFDSKNEANEWFITDLETVKKAISAVKEGKDSLHASEVSKTQDPIVFRPEQKEAIQKTIKQFKKSDEMLWFAKMRFGKTLSALQVAKEFDFNRTLILTHRPVVDKGWFEDFGKIFYDSPHFQYGSKNQGEKFSSLENLYKKQKSHYIYFASMQDLRGSELVGGSFDKNDEIFNTNWDFIIVDEAHEGTQTELGKNVLAELKKDKTKILHLSGTPFNLFDKYKEEEIYTWDYVMEQKAKANWDKIHFGDPNPYASLPKLNIFTYDLGGLLQSYIDEEVAFNFREFFRVDEAGEFLHKKDVISFLNLICKGDSESNYPYSTPEYRDNFRHSLWMVPGVREAKALSKLLKAHPVLGLFDIVNVAGDGDEEEPNEEALKKVENAITDKPYETYTITLSCGRLTTGVSVKAWTAVFMLSGSHNTSASGYMQTIFRVQTPATINGKVKEDCFVFDFAPDRTLKVIAETAKVSAKVGKTTDNDRNIMGEFLNFCPIIAIHGSQMRSYDVNGMLEQLKKVYVERVVRNGFEDYHLYNNDHLMKLESIDLQEFEGLKKIIGSTKAMQKSGDIDINKQGFTDEEYEKLEEAKKKKKHELTEEEKRLLAEKMEQRKNRDSAISILRGISIRMPLLIYGADVSNEEKEISIDNFTELVDDKSWEEYMPKGVTKETFLKFKKYYEPDVFRAAGKRIRALARAADQLTIEQRIERITSIFGTFRNPDKETVLTPWRVVNMHLGDCLGGYVFYDEGFENVLSEPRFVSHGKVTEEVFSPRSNILEINSKSGLYPLYVTYSIYRSRIEEKYQDKTSSSLSIEEQQNLWDKTVEENIFVICKTPMAKSITKRTLTGNRPIKINAHYFEDLVNQITNKAEGFVKKIKKGKTYWKANNDNDMKFNAVVGNPPYQENDGSGASDDAANPIYQHFVRITKEISPNYFSLIMPSKWMVGGKIVLKQFRLEMIEDKRITKFFDYEDSGEIFNGQHIDGGICYFLWNSDNQDALNYYYKPANEKQFVKSRSLSDGNSDIVIRDYRRLSILDKVGRDSDSFKNIVSLTRPFGVRKDLFNTPERYPNSNLKDEPFKGSVKIFGVKGIKGGAKRKIGFISRSMITKNTDLIDKYKLFFTTSYSTNAINPPSAIDGEPNTVCTETFLVFGPFESKLEQVSCKKYINSNFFKSLLFFGRGTMQVSQSVFRFIPIQDFSSNSDIDWTKPIPEIDQQLYKKYDLTEDEIDFIEKMIKPMTD
ncbi:MAG: hypothetical protein PWQ54_1011 [Bacteroidales bacterium]|jgi:hypothetical protein|nr:hypothetical protein [Bacteroidales bacterium]